MQIIYPTLEAFVLGQYVAGRVPNTLFDAHTILYSILDDTPLALTVGEQTLVGRRTGNNIEAVPIGISDNTMVQVDGAGISGRVAEWTVNGLTAANLIAPAANVLTLTNAAASTLALNISSGKTLTLTATDNYTATLPESMILAGRNVANTFTAAQKINVNSTTALHVEQDGVKDDVLVVDTTNGVVGIVATPTANQSLTITTPSATGRAIVINGSASQSGNYINIRDASANLVMSLTAAGVLNLAYSDTTLLNIDRPVTSTTGSKFGSLLSCTNNATSNSTANVVGFRAIGTQASSNTLSTLRGFQGGLLVTGTGTVASGAAVFNQIQFNVNATMTQANFLLDQVLFGGGVTAVTIETLNHIYLANSLPASGLSVTNHVGLNIGDITKGSSSNYAITTLKGLVKFGDQLNVVGSQNAVQFMVSGYTTQTQSSPVAQISRTDSAAGISRLLRLTGLGSGAAGDGVALAFGQKTSTTADQDVTRFDALWATATHASRKGRLAGYIYDTSARQWLQVDTDGSSPYETHYGDFYFSGSGSGLPFGSIYAYNVSSSVTITGTGIANKVQVTAFAVNGESNAMTPDYTTSKITVTVAGRYLCTVNASVVSGAGAGFEAGFSVFKNSGATQFQNLHAHRNLAGGGGDTGSIGMSGIISLSVNDTVEVWCWNETNTTSIIVDDITLSLVMVGG